MEFDSEQVHAEYRTQYLKGGWRVSQNKGPIQRQGLRADIKYRKLFGFELTFLLIFLNKPTLARYAFHPC